MPADDALEDALELDTRGLSFGGGHLTPEPLSEAKARLLGERVHFAALATAEEARAHREAAPSPDCEAMASGVNFASPEMPMKKKKCARRVPTPCVLTKRNRAAENDACSDDYDDDYEDDLDDVRDDVEPGLDPDLLEAKTVQDDARSTVTDDGARDARGDDYDDADFHDDDDDDDAPKKKLHVRHQRASSPQSPKSVVMIDVVDKTAKERKPAKKKRQQRPSPLVAGRRTTTPKKFASNNTAETQEEAPEADDDSGFLLPFLVASGVDAPRAVRVAARLMSDRCRNARDLLDMKALRSTGLRLTEIKHLRHAARLAVDAPKATLPVDAPKATLPHIAPNATPRSDHPAWRRYRHIKPRTDPMTWAKDRSARILSAKRRRELRLTE